MNEFRPITANALIPCWIKCLFTWQVWVPLEIVLFSFQSCWRRRMIKRRRRHLSTSLLHLPPLNWNVQIEGVSSQGEDIKTQIYPQPRQESLSPFLKITLKTPSSKHTILSLPQSLSPILKCSNIKGQFSSQGKGLRCTPNPTKAHYHPLVIHSDPDSSHTTSTDPLSKKNSNHNHHLSNIHTHCFHKKYPQCFSDHFIFYFHFKAVLVYITEVIDSKFLIS